MLNNYKMIKKLEKKVKEIILKTDAKIVLSTSWREHWDEDSQKCDEIGIKINNIFSNFGLKIFAKTLYKIGF